MNKDCEIDGVKLSDIEIALLRMFRSNPEKSQRAVMTYIRSQVLEPRLKLIKNA